MPALFVLAAMPLKGLVTGDFVLANPGVRVDAVQVSEAWTGGTRTVLVVRGATPSQLAAFEALLAKRYGNARTVQVAGQPAFRVEIAPQDVQSDVYRTLQRFAADGTLWWHAMTAQGHEMRVEVPSHAEGHVLLDRLAAFYRKMGLSVHGDVAQLPPSEEPALAQAREGLRLLSAPL